MIAKMFAKYSWIRLQTETSIGFLILEFSSQGAVDLETTKKVDWTPARKSEEWEIR